MKIIQKDSLKTIVSAVNKYVDFLSCTYGPAGKKILIATTPLRAVDDSHEASKEFELENEFENAVISYIKEVTKKTYERVKDGTTTAAILSQAIVKEVTKDMDDPFSSTNYYGKTLEIKNATLEVINHLKEKSKKIKTKADLYKIAYNSYNNKDIAELISDTIFKIGENGLMSVEDSQGVNTEVEIVKGLEIQKGLLSPYLINNDKEEAVLNDAHVIIINKGIDTYQQIFPLLKKIVVEGNQPFILIAESFSEQAMNNIIMDKLRGVFNPIIIEAPGFGENKIEVLQDIATITGAKVIDPKVNKLEEIDLSYLGKAKKIVSKTTTTTIIGGQGLKDDLQNRIKSLTSKLEGKIGYERENIIKRIASIEGGIALIKVGANTENEQKAIKSKVENSVNATKIAFKEGISKGAGLAYKEIKTTSNILNEVLKAPRKVLEENGLEYLDENATDATGVLIAALESATSLACELLTTGGIITNKREKKDKEIFDY